MTRTRTKPQPIFPELAGTRRFTIDEYHRLGEAGILGQEDKVELLDGYVLYKADYPELQPSDSAFPEWRPLRQWSRADYERMIDLGVIASDEKVELLDGYLVLKMPQNIRHRSAVTRLTTRLAPLLPAGWVMMTQCPIAVAGSAPEPDGIIVRGTDVDYDTRVPISADFGIVIEVSDSTLATDRRAKGPLYARAGIATYWIVNLIDRQVEVYTNPTSTAYSTRADFATAASVPVHLDGATATTIPVVELIP